MAYSDEGSTLMAYCARCGKAVSGVDRFCTSCGAQQQPKRVTNHRPHAAWIPALETEAGAAAYKKIAETIDGGRVKFFLASVCFLLGFLGFLAIGYNGVAWVFVIFAIGAFILMCSGGWTESLYYTIPGSRDGSGHHRCIKCGNRGIYRSGEYKSNVTHVNCSKCGRHFWSN
jgi:hypothetical protein